MVRLHPVGLAALLVAFGWGGAGHKVRAEELEITVAASTNPVALLVRAQGYSASGTMILYRREATGSYGPWTELTTNLWAGGGVGVWTDATVAAGTVYEYRADRSDFSGTGYGVGGLDIPAAEQRGRILLVVEDTLLAPLTNELQRLELDLLGDGWQVLRSSAPRYNPALSNAARVAHLATVRDAISNAYLAAGSLEAVYLLGHVPVPYTHVVQDPFWVGRSIPYPPDGHDTHAGCWPSDAYYADISGGTWSDSTVAWTNTTYPRCSTVPGDGKFDTWRIPSAVELQVGRVDLSALPAFGLSETELMRRYLDKVHRYRRGGMPMQRRGAVTDDHTPVRRSLPSWFGPGGYAVTNFPNAMQDTNGYYAAYANGAGSFTSVGLHYTTTDVVTRDPRFFLQMALGSYFGDWDYTNDLLRATLAGASGGLAALWVLDFGSTELVDIAWSLNHLALGETLGSGVRFTQNRGFEGTARPSPAFTLLGDPTLRLFPVAPPGALSASNSGSDVVLNWTAAAEPGAPGYHVYQSTNGLGGPYARITEAPVAGLSHTHTNALPGTSVYQVRAVKRETTGAGTYDNTSQGVFSLASSDLPPLVTLTVEPAQVAEGGGGAVLMFHRTGPVTDPLAVPYGLGGTAGTDDVVEALSGSVIIPAGSAAAVLPLTVADDARLEATESLTVRLLTNATFQAGLFEEQTLVITDNDTIPAPPTNVVAEVEGGSVRVNWSDASSNETRFVIERRDVTAGGVVILDTENTNQVSLSPANSAWPVQYFTNAYGGSCRAWKQSNTSTHYWEFRPQLGATMEMDLDVWYPSGSTGGAFVAAQTVTVVHVSGTNTVYFYPRSGGGRWQPLGRFTLGTGSYVRVQSASASGDYSVADALRLAPPFVVWTQVEANVTGWVDVVVSSPGVYEYRVSAGLDNTSSVPSARVLAQLGGAGANRTPVPNAGPDQSAYHPTTNQLAGSASDPDDGPAALAAAWYQVSGPGLATFSNTNQFNTAVTFSTNGIYVLGLAAGDGSTTAVDTVTITVKATLIASNSLNGVEFALDEDTIALWHFNGDVLDATTNGYHLTVSNGCTIVTGGTATAWMAAPSGAALRIVNYPHNASYSFLDAVLLNTTNRKPLTVEARFFFEGWGSNSASYKMMAWEQNYDTLFSFEQSNAGSPYGKVVGNSGVEMVSEVEMGALMSTGTWHHLMLVFDGTNTYRTYLDGVPIGQPLNGGPNWGRSTAIPVTFGNFKGYVDEARVSRAVRYVAPPVNTNPPVASELGAGSALAPGGQGISLAFGTVTDQLYRVEFASTLFTDVWETLSNNIPGSGLPLVIGDPAVATGRFYRVFSWRP